jgi:hypothetical protein
MLGAMREATLYVALAQDHDQARQEAGAVMDRLIGALGGLFTGALPSTQNE